MSGFVIDHYGAAWLWGTCAVLGTVAAAGYWLLMRNLDLPEPVVAASPVPEDRAVAEDPVVAEGRVVTEVAV